jgi:hypothetical protein
MQRVLRELDRRGLCLHEMQALEVFAHCGFLHSKDYHRRVASLEAWELDPQQEADLRRNLPGAEVKITDSFAEIRKTTRNYDLIIVDAPENIFGDRGQFCEHFEMLPEVFHVVTDSAVVILNALVGYPADNRARRRFTTEQLDRRRRFYGTDHPEMLRVTEMAPVYWRLLNAHGFELEWYFTVPRTLDKRLHYFVLKMKRRPTQLDLKG